MKKTIYKLLVIAIILSISFISCTMDDESDALGFQDKKLVNVEEITSEDSSEDKVTTDLKPGIHKDTITFENAKDKIRIFKYYFPKSLDISKPISLVFDFHGSTETSPIDGISEGNFLNRLANNENIIMVYPLGTIQDGTNTYNWTSDENLLFFDAMINYFKASKNPIIDTDRIYACGQSSGAIFSYELAMKRSEILAAVVPISGQYKIPKEDFIKPTRTVAIRGINGINDKTVNYTAAVENISIWAEKVGDYTQKPTSENIIEIEDNYNTIHKKDYVAEVKYWRGASNDIQFFGIRNEGHGVAWGVMLPYLWDFMKSHTLKDGSCCFMMLPSIPVKMKFETTKSIKYSISTNTNCTLKSCPEGWNVIIEENSIKLTAPEQNVGEASGDVIFALTKDGIESEKTLSVEGRETDGYKIGQFIMSKDKYKDPLTIVYWVDPENKYNAKAVTCSYGKGNYETYSYYKSGDGELKWIYTDTDLDTGLDIGCTSISNGKSNTDKILEAFPNRSHTAIHCSKYRPHFKAYIPAINELTELLDLKIINKLNSILAEKNLDPIATDKLYWSSTEVKVEGRGLQIFCRSAEGGKDVILNYDATDVHTRGIMKVGDWE